MKDLAVSYQTLYPKLVVIESPLKANTRAELRRNLLYARAALYDSTVIRREAGFPSHVLYTQVMDDNDPVLRQMGIMAGLAWGRLGHVCAVYTDLGVSEGMQEGINRHHGNGLRIEHRSIPDWLDVLRRGTFARCLTLHPPPAAEPEKSAGP